jgi:Tol biopolymer transport system component
MKKVTVLLLAVCAVSAGTNTPQKIVFARVFPNAGQVGLFIAHADGSDEHPLLNGSNIDYDPVWSPDGSSIVFTSDREGSADLFRIKPDGTGLERLTDSPAYDDQAAFSPDSKQLVFVTSRANGTADLWTMELASRRAKALTSGPGGDFRPSWSPDGQWIAFSSDRGGEIGFAHGRWEGLQVADLFVIHPDGTGLKRITEHGDFCGSPKWRGDSRHVIAYCMTAEQTLANRQPNPVPGNDTRLRSFDIASGDASDVPSGPGVKFNPAFVGSTVAYLRKDSPTGANLAGIYYAEGRRGPIGDVRAASWSPDGTRVVFHRRLVAQRPTWTKIWSRNPAYDLTLSGQILPSFSPSGDRMAVTGRPTPGSVLGSTIVVVSPGSDAQKVIYQDAKRNVLGPQWSPSGSGIVFGIGTFNAFFNGFNGLFLKPGDRAEDGAQIAIVNPDGTGFRELTTGPNNNAFPSMAPDGKRIVFRSFGADGHNGLKIFNLDTNSVTPLTNEYDNFPLWSPRGDLIMFSRFAENDYDIYTIKPDGTGLKRLSFSHGNDAHQGWSPDGERIVFASSRMGFKDEVVYTDAPQPYGELFTMKKDGTDLHQLTDNQWEDGTPAWQPAGK